MLKPKESIQKMAPYVGPGEGRMGFLRLDFNENLLGASPKVLEAIGKVTQETYGCYPEYGKLTAALSHYLGVNSNSVIATNGSDEAIKTLFDCYVEKGDEVILLTPSYNMYELYAQVAGANIVWIPYAEGFRFPLEEILSKIRSDTRLIVLANPNNPTGTLIAKEELVRIIEANPKMAVLIDEAYGAYAKTTNIDLAERYSNVFITQTFSKAHGLAGLRIGYLVSAKENIDTVSKVLSSMYSVDTLAAAAALAAMEDRQYVKQYVDRIIDTREWFVEQINALGFEVIQSHANFVLVRFGRFASQIKEALLQEKILVRSRSDLGGYLRISIGSKEQMDRMLKVLEPFRQVTALIFDMDGVLVDESKSYRPCILQTVENFIGSSIDPKMIEILKQEGGYNNDYDCTEAILGQFGCKVRREEIIERFDACYREHKFQERWLVDEELLYQLKQRFKLGIFTGRPKKDALDALQRFGKDLFFEVVITDDDVLKRKPYPEGLFMAMSKLNATKVIYFGDSIDDREAARRADVEFVEVEAPGIGLNEKLKEILCRNAQ